MIGPVSSLRVMPHHPDSALLPGRRRVSGAGGGGYGQAAPWLADGNPPSPRSSARSATPSPKPRCCCSPWSARMPSGGASSSTRPAGGWTGCCCCPYGPRAGCRTRSPTPGCPPCCSAAARATSTSPVWTRTTPAGPRRGRASAARSAAVTGPLDMYVTQCRLRGYREALAAAGRRAPSSPPRTPRQPEHPGCCGRQAATCPRTSR